MTDARLFYPATARNRGPILDVLRTHLAQTGSVIEIASGSGEHVVHFARALSHLRFLPSDPEGVARASVDAWVRHEGLANVAPAASLDVEGHDPWPLTHAAAVLCINMIHIAPWVAAEGLLRGAAQSLAPGGVLYLYGPYKRGGEHTAPSNEEFDRSLRTRNTAWGVRDLEEVMALAAGHGFSPPVVITMPANNLSVIFRKDAPSR